MAAVDDSDTYDVTNTSAEDVIRRALQDDLELNAVVEKLNTSVIIDPDRELDVDASDSIPRDSDSASNSSSLRDVEDNFADDYSPKGSPLPRKALFNGQAKDANGSLKPTLTKSSPTNSSIKSTDKKGSSDSSRKNSLEGKGNPDTVSLTSKKSTRKNPLKLLKKLTKFDKPKNKPDYRSEFSAVVVGRLPQVFVVKYLGQRPVNGVCGLHHVRQPVDEMVKAIRTEMEEKAKTELPLLYVVVSPKGIDLREHKSNKVAGVAPVGLLPIDFISYGVQDIKYWRVFTCIIVSELASRSRTRSATCHAFLCDSAHNGRKMALSLGAAFNMYSRQLKSEGKLHNFQIELRPPDELADALDTEFEA
ncbi:unnamed protein product [Lymnaea stagnalis]|uniref:PID domain-containing protein n=1 Tax=Lymnaea stagnalis TaxID=6523 RepID=A0AAV2IJ14_LYMST